MAVALGTGALLALPVFGEKKPQSILPPGFGTTPPPEAPKEPRKSEEPRASERKAPEAAPAEPGNLAQDLNLGGNAAARAPKSAASVPAETDLSPDALGNAVAAAEDAPVEPPPVYDLPPQSRKTLAHIGVIGTPAHGLGPNAFGATDGPALERLMRATPAPIASRWLSITLRRTLLSDTATPPRVHGADWVAERAWLLLRMGEADAARLLIQQVDSDNYTPKLYAVAIGARQCRSRRALPARPAGDQDQRRAELALHARNLRQPFGRIGRGLVAPARGRGG